MIYDIYLKSDMLSCRKVKLHGMSDVRWTAKNKISQYKGLINLYRREKKILLSDKIYTSRRDKYALYQLKRNVAISKQNLDNAVFGDRQNIKNVLAGHRQLQLAYQYLLPQDIIEHISQINFNFRKQLDLLICRKQAKAQELVDLKLRVSELQDRLVYEAPGSLPVELMCQRLTARVQDAILNKEAAIVVNEAYKKILVVCKKDQIYFDSILESIGEDHRKQGKCMLDTIVLGQTAMEYLDDRKQEFHTLEKIVKQSMRERQTVLDELRVEVTKGRKMIKFFIRRDSVVTLPKIGFRFINADVRKQLNSVSELLDSLKNSLLVNSYDKLHSCLYEQLQQKNKLKGLSEQFQKNKDMLQNKTDQANVMYNELFYTMNETTLEYKHEKQLLKKSIAQQEKKITECRRLQQKYCLIMLKIRTCLQHLEEMCKYVKEPISVRRANFVHQNIKRDMSYEQYLSNIEAINDVIDIKENSQAIIDVLIPKLLSVTAKTYPSVEEKRRDLAEIKFEKLVGKRTKAIPIEEHKISESLLEDVEFDDPSVPSRADIKALSQEIVTANTVNEDLLPVFDSRFRSKNIWRPRV